MNFKMSALAFLASTSLSAVGGELPKAVDDSMGLSFSLFYKENSSGHTSGSMRIVLHNHGHEPHFSLSVRPSKLKGKDKGFSRIFKLKVYRYGKDGFENTPEPQRKHKVEEREQRQREEMRLRVRERRSSPLKVGEKLEWSLNIRDYYDLKPGKLYLLSITPAWQSLNPTKKVMRSDESNFTPPVGIWGKVIRIATP